MTMKLYHLYFHHQTLVPWLHKYEVHYVLMLVISKICQRHHNLGHLLDVIFLLELYFICQESLSIDCHFIHQAG